MRGARTEPAGEQLGEVVLVVAVDKATGHERPDIGFDVFWNVADADRALNSANLVAKPGLCYRMARFQRTAPGDEAPPAAGTAKP